ncbi:MAG: M1 family metallopeptidase [Candidatus Aminicenantia bacterium]
MRRVFFLFLLSSILFSEEVVYYKIKAKLSPKEKIVRGEETINWRNITSKPVSEIYLHLYLNAFKNEQSTFMRERRVIPRKMDWGYCEIKKMKINGESFKEKIQFVQPDDGNIYDRTLVRIPLGFEVKPEEAITISINFDSKLPKLLARTGYSKDFFMVAQWFPKIAVLREEGWNAHQFHRNSEFFSDFGKYEVEIRVPEEYSVVASGFKEGERKEERERVLLFKESMIHDFAWSASLRHKIFTEKFSMKEPNVNTEIILFLDREHLCKKERYLYVIKKSIEFFSRNYGPYPYRTITVIDPPFNGREAGGMEYPTLITAGTGFGLQKGILLQEMVTLHEFGHQYWYGMCANNEFEEAWLDEGINSYSEVKGMSEIFGEKTSMFNILGFKIGDMDIQRLRYISFPIYDPIYRKSYEFISSESYSVTSYAKSALMLLTLERYLGKETFSRLMKEYFNRWKFKHPKTEDFIKIVNEISGKDMNWFFDSFLFGDGEIDYRVEYIRTKRLEKPTGIVDFKFKDEGKWESEVAIFRDGNVSFPVRIEIEFDDGKRVSEFWDGKERWKKMRYIKSVKVKSVRIDPDDVLLLDRNRFNNSMTSEVRSPYPMGLSLKFIALIQSFLFSF